MDKEKKVNLRIQVENDAYRMEGEEEDLSEMMELDEPEDNPFASSAPDHVDAEIGIKSLITPQAFQTPVFDTLSSARPKSPEDGECSGDSSSGEDTIEHNWPRGRDRELDNQFSKGYDEPALARPPRRYPNPFVTDDGSKRASRALRFGDAPLKIAEIVKPLDLPSDEQLLNLYISCGLISEEGGEATLDKVGGNVRQDSILIRGINSMSTKEIFDYLYGKGLVPQEMEWVNDACCVVIYKDKYEAAASLLHATKPISIDPEIIDKKKNLLNEDKTEADGLARKDSAHSMDATDTPFDYDSATVIPHEVILVPMPLGHVWRFAKPNDKAKGILMRFATVRDKKQERAEKHSEYYRKYGNPNVPDLAYATERTRQPRRRDLSSLKIHLDSRPPATRGLGITADNKNAWSVLSADWNDEESSRSGREVRVETPHPPVQTESRRRSIISNGGYRNHRKSDVVWGPMYINNRSSIRDRLGGTGRDENQKSLVDSDEDTRDRALGQRRAIPSKSRKRRRSVEDGDDEGFARVSRQISRDQEDNEDEDEDEDSYWTSRLSGPRMKMHADEEEDRIKLQAVRKHRTPPRTPQRSSVFSSGRLETSFSLNHY